MDSIEEDLSARVLLRRVLHTELPRSPVTRSSTSVHTELPRSPVTRSSTSVRRSMRVKNTPGLESPGSALRHRLKKKLHESVSQSPLPSPKRRRSTVTKSPLYDEDMTTRGLLRGIIQMETDASLLMSGQPALQIAEPNPAESSVSSAGERTEGLSGVELSDLTLNTEPLTHVVRRLSRRKPQRAFSVSAFERQFDQLPDNTEDVSHVSHRGEGPQEKPETSHDFDLSAGSKSGLNLTLKTPFVDKRSERAGLQRKVSNRKLPSVDAFDEAVQRCLEQGPKQDHSVVQDGNTLEDSSWQKFTLGLNDVTELYVHSKKDETVGPSPSKEEEKLAPSSQEAGDDVFLSPGDYIVLAPTQAMTESLPESQDVELQDRESIVEVEDTNVEEEAEDENVEEEAEDENVEEEAEDENVEEEAEDENVEEEAEDENVEEEAEDENVEEEAEDENVEEEAEDENVEEEAEDENVEEEAEDVNVEEEVEDENVEEEIEVENVEEEVEDENVEEEVEDGNVEEDQNVEEEVEGENMEEDENVEEEVEDKNVEEEFEDENVEEEVEDKNVEEEVEDENVEEDQNVEEEVEGENMEEDESVEEEFEDENVVEVEDENMEEVEDENMEEENVVEDEHEEVEEAEDENIEENPDASHHPERITRRAHRSEGGGAVPGVPASTRVTKSFGAGLNPREKDHLEFVDGNRESLQDVTDEEREQAGSPVAEVTTSRRRSSLREASLAEEDLSELVEHHDAPEEVSQSEEELMDSEPANQSPEPPQEEEEEEEDDDNDDALSAELSMKTPAFVRQKRVFASSSAQAMPTVLKEVNAGPPQVAKRAPRKKRQTEVNVLPKSYVMSVFKHFAKTKVASDVYPVINEFLKKYFERLADDLEVYATHAKRKTIEIEDFELLMRRQGFVTDGTPVNILIEKYLPLEYRKLLIPVATSGNQVIPTQRR
ncbi:unnamed protein product [Leuciscus chuanchicus]